MATDRATPTIRLLDRRKARGSSGCVINSQSCSTLAVIMNLLGIFLKGDLESKVAASLRTRVGQGFEEKHRESVMIVPQKAIAVVSPREELRTEEHSWLRNE